MGARFYGSHPDKTEAMKIATLYAKNYRKGVCYTPSREDSCVFDSAKGMWTCSATAHHHWGSCGKHELYSRGRPGQDGGIAIGTTFPWNPKSMDKKLPSDSEPSSEPEIYSDATPEDYVQGEASKS